MKHKKEKHAGEKPFSCKVCEKTFQNDESLTVHFRMHTGTE